MREPGTFLCGLVSQRLLFYHYATIWPPWLYLYDSPNTTDVTTEDSTMFSGNMLMNETELITTESKKQLHNLLRQEVTH